MDWANLVADEGLWLDRHYTEGRGGHAIEGVTVHHMAGDLSLADCLRVWQAAPTSAHYAVDRDGRVAQMVHDRDTAWACGDWDANCRTISVEHANSGSGPWTVHEAAMEAGAHLVAAICLAYGLGRPEWGVNVFPHCHWAQTACPGELWGSQRDGYIERCRMWYDRMAAGEEGDMTPNDFWAFDNGEGGKNAWRTLREVQRRIGAWWDGTDERGGLLTQLAALRVEVAALDGAVRALAASQGADPDAVAKAVSEAVAARLAAIRLSVEGGGDGRA